MEKESSTRDKQQTSPLGWEERETTAPRLSSADLWALSGFQRSRSYYPSPELVTEDFRSQQRIPSGSPTPHLPTPTQNPFSSAL